MQKGDSKDKKATIGGGRKRNLWGETTSKVCFLGKLNRNVTDTISKVRKETLLYQFKLGFQDSSFGHNSEMQLITSLFSRLKGWKSRKSATLIFNSVPFMQFSLSYIIQFLHAQCLSLEWFPFLGGWCYCEKGQDYWSKLRQSRLGHIHITLQFNYFLEELIHGQLKKMFLFFTKFRILFRQKD